MLLEHSSHRVGVQGKYLHTQENKNQTGPIMKGKGHEQRKNKKTMSATELVLDQVLNSPTWTVRAPEDVRKLLAETIRETGVNKLSPFLWDIIRDELKGQVREVLKAKQERRRSPRQEES